jgi:hypothetical protein
MSSPLLLMDFLVARSVCQEQGERRKIMQTVEKIKGLALSIKPTERVGVYLEDGRQIWISLSRIVHSSKAIIVVDAPKTVTILRETLTLEANKCQQI